MAVNVGEDRSPEALAFIAAVDAVCKEHGYAICHEDSEGAFEIVRDMGYRLWFVEAHEIVSDPSYPVGTVVLDKRDDVWQQEHDGLWCCVGIEWSVGYRELLERSGPLRVIHLGEN